MLAELLIAAAVFVALPALMLGLVRVLDTATPLGPGHSRWLTGWKAWHMAIALVLSALLYFGATGHHGASVFPAFLAALVVLALFLRAWRHEFLTLMALRDDDFPGRHDKLVWVLLLTTFAPIGLWFFRSFREAHWPEPETIKGAPVGDLI